MSLGRLGRGTARGHRFAVAEHVEEVARDDRARAADVATEEDVQVGRLPLADDVECVLGLGRLAIFSGDPVAQRLVLLS